MSSVKPRSNRSRAGQQRQLKTAFLRVPTRDWAMVINGRQSEFRVALGNPASAYGLQVRLPLPLFVVAYRTRHADHKLLTLEEVRRERLIEISDDGLRRAGYSGDHDEAFARFRRDWMVGEKKRFEPNREVVVYRVRLPVAGDFEAVAANLLKHLYSVHLGELGR